MSLLDELKKKRSALKATTTILTTAGGDKFIENVSCNRGERVKIDNRSYGFVVDTKPDLLPACILDDFLYLGSQDAVSWETIVTYKLTHILSIGIETPSLAPLSDSSSSLSVQTEFIPCLDLPNTDLLENVIPNAVEFIESAREHAGRILVHCNAGVSRSTSVVIAYLMIRMKFSYQNAYELLKSRRECIQPNVGFIRQLKEMEMEL